MPLISVNDVQIKGLTVEIKSLVVGKKQLTLSLMRQFIEESIVDEDHMLFRGVPWGFINYFWGEDKHKTPDNYIHLIWQKGDQLRRCVLHKKYYMVDIERTKNHCAREVNEGIDEITRWNKRLSETKDYLTQAQERGDHWIADNYTKEIRELEIKVTKKQSYINEERIAYNAIDRFIKINVPKYNQLIASTKDLPHFFIAV